MPTSRDQLDDWIKTLTECDTLYREVQLLVRINPTAYREDSDAIVAVGASNPNGREDDGYLHPQVFAQWWTRLLAEEAHNPPPRTNTWDTLIRYITAHVQYLDGDDIRDFNTDLRQLRGQLGALVNEHRLARGEADALSALNAHEARKALRTWALDSDKCMTRKELSAAFPTLGPTEWTRLRVRKHRSGQDIPARQYPVRWAAEIAPEDDDTPIPAITPHPYRDAMSRGVVSLESLDEELNYLDYETGMVVLATKGKRKTQENPNDL